MKRAIATGLWLTLAFGPQWGCTALVGVNNLGDGDGDGDGPGDGDGDGDVIPARPGDGDGDGDGPPDGGVEEPSDGGAVDAGSSGDGDGDGDGDVTPEPDPNWLNQDTLFVCDGSPGSSPARLRRMERREWTNTVNKPNAPTWYGSQVRNNPLDAPGRHLYTTYDKGVSLDESTLDLLLAVLPEAGSGWVARSGGNLGVRTYTVYNDNALNCMWNDAQPDAACIDYYTYKYLEEGVLFRPPTDEERSRLAVFLTDALAAETDVSQRDNTLSLTTQAAWLTSGALFKSELGKGAALPDGRRRLDEWETARALSSLISRVPPGLSGTFAFDNQHPVHPNWTAPPEGYLPDIKAAAADGTITDPAVMDTLLRNNVGGVDMQRFDLLDGKRNARGEYWLASRVVDFFREWLGYTDVRIQFKDTPGATSAYNNFNVTTSYNNLLSGYYADESLLDEQLDDTIAKVVIDDTDVFANLLTTRTWRLPSNMVANNGGACTDDSQCTGTCGDHGYCVGSIWKAITNLHRPYNLDVNVPDTFAGRWVDMDPAERAGVLTHPAWLAAHGGNFEDDASIVHRGHWIRENLLCEDVPNLELVMVEAKLVPSDPGKSARDRLVESVEQGPDAVTCMGCHSQMNSLGYPFEVYNHAGFVRATDHGGAPDGTSTIDNAPDPVLNTSVQDAVELSQLLAQSNHAKRCFIRQAFRFFAGRNETTADACTLTAMETAYDEQGSFIDMLSAFAQSDAFLYRHDEEVAP